MTKKAVFPDHCGGLGYVGILLAITLATLSCSTTRKAPTRDSELRVLEKEFLDALKEKNLQVASRLRLRILNIYPLPPEWAAQFFLLNCQPRLAMEQIETIPNEDLRNAFKAMTFALLSISRPVPPVLEKPIVKPTRGSRDKKVIYEIYPLEEEVWADEWDYLHFSRAGCEKFPEVIGEKLRAAYQQKARELFESVKNEVFLRDFNFTALALDVGATPKNLSALLEHYKTQASDPYYARLTYLEQTKTTAPEVTPLKTKGASIDLSEMNLTKVDLNPHSLGIPFLLPNEEAE